MNLQVIIEKIYEKVEYINGLMGFGLSFFFVSIPSILSALITKSFMIDFAQCLIKSVSIVIISSFTGFFITRFLKKKYQKKKF